MKRIASAIAIFALFAAAPSALLPLAARAATALTDVNLKGALVAQPLSSITIANAATIEVQSGANVIGLIRDLNNPTLTGNVIIAEGSVFTVNSSPAYFGHPVIMQGVLNAGGGVNTSFLTASGDVSIAGNMNADVTYLSELYVSPNGTHLSGLFVSDTSTFAGAATFQASATAAAGLYSQGTTQLLGGGLLNGDFTVGSDLITSTPTDTTLTFRMTSDVFFSGGALLRADNDARLRGVARAARYAVFYIPLGIYGHEWTDFELKGSVNNYTGQAEDALVYFYGSQYGTGGSTHGQIGTTKAVYFTDTMNGHSNGVPNHGFARKWRRQNATQSIYAQRAHEDSVVGGVVVVVPVNAVINPHNAELQFIYQRVSASNMEEVWVPIAPQWLIADPRPAGLPVPADNQPIPPSPWLNE